MSEYTCRPMIANLLYRGLRQKFLLNAFELDYSVHCILHLNCTLACTILPIKIFVITSKVTAPQDAGKRLVLQVYLGLNTLEFSVIRR